MHSNGHTRRGSWSSGQYPDRADVPPESHPGRRDSYYDRYPVDRFYEGPEDPPYRENEWRDDRGYYERPASPVRYEHYRRHENEAWPRYPPALPPNGWSEPRAPLAWDRSRRPSTGEDYRPPEAWRAPHVTARDSLPDGYTPLGSIPKRRPDEYNPVYDGYHHGGEPWPPEHPPRRDRRMDIDADAYRMDYDRRSNEWDPRTDDYYDRDPPPPPPAGRRHPDYPEYDTQNIERRRVPSNRGSVRMRSPPGRNRSPIRPPPMMSAANSQLPTSAHPPGYAANPVPLPVFSTAGASAAERDRASGLAPRNVVKTPIVPQKSTPLPALQSESRTVQPLFNGPMPLPPPSVPRIGQAAAVHLPQNSAHTAAVGPTSSYHTLTATHSAKASSRDHGLPPPDKPVVSSRNGHGNSESTGVAVTQNLARPSPSITSPSNRKETMDSLRFRKNSQSSTMPAPPSSANTQPNGNATTVLLPAPTSAGNPVTTARAPASAKVQPPSTFASTSGTALGSGAGSASVSATIPASPSARNQTQAVRSVPPVSRTRLTTTENEHGLPAVGAAIPHFRDAGIRPSDEGAEGTQPTSLAEALRCSVMIRRDFDHQTYEERVNPVLTANLISVDQPQPQGETHTDVAAEVMDTVRQSMAQNSFATTRAKLALYMSERHASLEEKIRTMRKEYLRRHSEWMAHCAQLDDANRSYEPEETANATPAAAGRATRRSLVGIGGDAVRSDLEMELIIASLGNEELTDPNHLALRNLATIPDMISAKGETVYTYDDSNSFVLDPHAFYAPRTGFQDWTEEEKDTFVREFAAAPKQFGIIADALEHKTTAQCVAFYYLHKKTFIDFRKVITLYAPKRRRGGRKTDKRKGNALLADIARHDEVVSKGRATRGRKPKANVMGEDTATPTPERDLAPKQRKRRTVRTATSALDAEDMDDIPLPMNTS